MKSPFPGMDPFLEGYIWPDVHNSLSYKIRQQLMNFIQPKYFAHMNIYVVQDTQPEGDIGILYPDVEVMLSKAEEPQLAYTGTAVTIAPATTSVKFKVEAHIPVIEIRNRANKKLVTAIEIIFPVNKKSKGLAQYVEKRQKLYEADVHLLEIDLIRRGIKVVESSKLDDVDYYIALTRARTDRTDLWLVDLQEKLPVVPVPLLKPDPDVPLDLQRALNEVYEEAAYHVSMDYAGEVPPPQLVAEKKTWMKKLLEK